MAVHKELICIHCKKSLPFGQGFVHDEELNFICSHCSKPLFGVTEAAEEEVKKVSSPNVSSMGFVTGGWRKEPLPIRIASSVQEEEEQQEEVQVDQDLACFC